jgi:hypothetical protein
VRGEEDPGQPRGQPGAGNGECGQRPIGGQRGEPARQHATQGPRHRDHGGIGVAQPDGGDQRDGSVHRHHRRPGRRPHDAVLRRVQQHHQVVQDDLSGAEHHDRAEQAPAALGQRHEHGGQQGKQHDQQAEIAEGAAARDVTDGGEQPAERGQGGAPERALTSACPHGP